MAAHVKNGIEPAEEELDATTINQRRKLFVRECSYGNIGIVKEMLHKGVEVDARDSLQATGLIMASRNGLLQIVLLLVDNGADVNAEDRGFSPPLYYASKRGRLDVVKVLISRGANVLHTHYDGSSALHHASRADHFSVCEFLVSKGADLTATTSKGDTPLSLYGLSARPHLSPETKALRCAALEAAWAAGPHPSQVQRRRDECWARRGPLITVLAEHAYRPLQLRALAMSLAAAELDPAAPIEPVALVTSQQRHAYLLGRVFSNEGIVRLLAALL